MTEQEFHLCQPTPLTESTPSCGACCGVYNYRGHNRDTIAGIMRTQTELMATWDGTDQDIERIRAEVEKNRSRQRFSVIYNCPFSGFLDEAETRVGCLLHPLKLGRDLRDHCRYGHRTCGEAKCTAYTYLSDKEAKAVMASARDWYIYGLAITDIDLVKDFFELCEVKLCAPVDPGLVPKRPELVDIFQRYLDLKEDWPLATDPGRFGKYYFVGREYNIYIIDYRALGKAAPFHNGILLSLGSVIETREELDRGLEIIDALVDEFCEAYSSRDAAGKSSRAAGGKP